MAPLPKRKFSTKRTGTRETAKMVKSFASLVVCKNCGKPMMPHRPCKFCGTGTVRA